MFDRKDDFWDIAALLPKKTKSTATSSHGEISVPDITNARDVALSETREEREARALHATASDGESVKSDYAPADNPFITRVRVLARRSHMRLFHGFKSDGAAWQALRGTPCPYAPFFSFVPQYEQLNEAQKAYYLYFREEANSGNFLDAGQSYVLLYIFEILNLPEFIPPKIGILRLAKIWNAYRRSMPILDKNLIPWLADYGLLHGVGCPRDILSSFLDVILSKSNLKEFYLGFEEGNNDTLDALILLTSQYRYENGRYATGEHAALFRTHIRQAASAVLRHVFLDGGKIKYQTVTKRFDAFAGALWAGASRYELEVTYYSVSGTDDLKILMTAAVKYAENKLRSYLSIKSRLSVSCLPDPIRGLLDAYFAKALPPKQTQAPVTRPEYEIMYEPLSEGISLKDAKEIEQSSWENTWRLIPESEKEEIFSENPQEDRAPFASCPPSKEAIGLTETQRHFLRFLMEGKEDAARRFAKEAGESYLTLGEGINEYFADSLGDVVLELVGEDYSVVSDYEDEIRAAIDAQI
ncbi:MAG: hypothetical protein E7609_00770 [Ruminococcaceae bacterium]|nr:hypothetical protein [Oscillospiraceae bacterium]